MTRLFALLFAFSCFPFFAGGSIGPPIDGTTVAEPCEGCATGLVFNGGSSSCATVVVQASVAREGECDDSCGTEKTCRFSYSVVMTATSPCAVLMMHTVCSGGPPQVCLEYPVTLTGGFEASTGDSGFDIVCGRSENFTFQGITAEGPGPVFGRLLMSCSQCTGS